MLMGMIVNFPQPMLTKELAAVMINLSHNAKNVEQMITNRGLNYLMDRLDNTKDPLLLKIIRNISAWTYNQQKVNIPIFAIRCSVRVSSSLDRYI